MNQKEWHEWCKDVTKRLTNLEKTLNKYHTIQKRMLWFDSILLIGLVGLNGLLLFYK